ncbi:MAG: universal stress protein [Deltaproteobacteria bacterium]|nr:universal stress protein [Deltaproteobacteria bacterium]
MINRLHVLVPVDFSTISLNAIRAVKKLAFPSARITLLHVYNPLPSSASVSYELAPAQDLIFAHLEKRLFNALQEIRRTELAGSEDVGVELECTSFLSPAKAICQFAESKSVDLIVLTTHGRTGLSHMLMGSVAEEVVRTSTCPVLVVRSDRYFNVERDQSDFATRDATLR